MSGTPSPRAERWLVPAWAIFATVNIALMFALPGTETVPFHLVWVSLAVVFGLRPWPLAATYAVLVVMCVLTGLALALHAQNEVIRWEEATEVPLMALLFLVMVWHVRRRIAAGREAERLADSERQMHAVQKRFVRFASHELRTPITVARGYAELIREQQLGPQAAADAGIVLEELDKLERIAARLLTLSRVDEPSARPVPLIDLDALLHRTITRWRPTAQRDWSLRTDAGFVAADAERLEAALDSLLENAVRFTGRGGVIELVGRRDRRDGGGVVIEVRDEGMGIPEDEQAFVFESFRSGRNGGGTGMGLAIVKAVVEAHGGHVSCASRTGLGTTFTMALPAARTATLHPALSSQSVTVPSSHPVLPT